LLTDEQNNITIAPNFKGQLATWQFQGGYCADADLRGQRHKKLEKE